VGLPACAACGDAAATPADRVSTTMNNQGEFIDSLALSPLDAASPLATST
jgi:hypothetical protein